MNAGKIITTLIHVLLTIVISIFIVTGFGITNYQIIESLTGGIVSKLLSFQIHSNLVIPLIVLLSAHIGITIGKKFRRTNNPQLKDT